MLLEVEWVDDTAGIGLEELRSQLRQDPRMDDTRIERGRRPVPQSSLGASEVLEIVATNVGLGLIANALYDYLRQRRRQDGSRSKFRLRRTDHPDGTRVVEIDIESSALTVEQAVRDTLEHDWGQGDGRGEIRR